MRAVNLLFICLTCISWTYAGSNNRLPFGFKLGTASSAYQVEGGWDADGKGPQLFDSVTHRVPSIIRDNSTGDVACDSYHKWEEDVKNVKAIGLDFYRFSLSWSRILPTGYANNVNQAGINYYKNLINALRAVNVEPVVTIFHWDLPLPLVQLGGWNNESIIPAYVDYANVVFRELGDSVRTWTTFNEPQQICTAITNLGTNNSLTGINQYLCAHNILRAHAKAYRLYQIRYKLKQRGDISMNLNSDWFEPATPSDEKAAQRTRDFVFGWFAHPIVYGRYPSVMVKRIKERSLAEGLPKSRLPEFTLLEKLELVGSYDYIALNHYTTNKVAELNDTSSLNRYEGDISVDVSVDESWEGSASSWLKVVPWGFRKLLVWIKKSYLNPKIMVTENGYSDHGELDNPRRTNYYKQYMQAMLDAIHDDGVRVSGYAIWSLMDSFEWTDGYTVKFGLYHVDFNDANRTRTAKSSIDFIKNVVQTRHL